ncbi:MAG TPA: hypothetical protein VFE10_14485 [Phenylobacterium sp.]|jgi:uncharacterized membrane protein YfcA|nr:hypothetical protein [Phenylobacterium sp.]
MSLPPDQSLKALWQGQETEHSTMTVQAIRILVNDYRRTARLRAGVGVGIGLLSAVFLAWCAKVAPNDVVRIGDLLVLAGTALGAWISWTQQPRRTPDAASSTMGLIDFYRSQVAREAPNLRLMAAILAPAAVGMVVIFAGLWPKIVAEHVSAQKTFLNFLPILLLLAAWVYLFAVRLRRQKRDVAERLQEIDAMRGL